MNNQCKQVSPDQLQRLQRLVDNTTDDPERLELEAHLSQCTVCQTAIVELADPDMVLHLVAPMLPKLFGEPSLPDLQELRSVKDGANGLLDSRDLRTQETISVMIGPEMLQSDLVETGLPELEVANSNEPRDLLQPASHPELLGRIGDFEVEKEIGRGGCGIVYKGFDSELNRPVAIKVLAPQLAANGIARKRFAREAQAVAAVRHPNVVEIHRVSKDPMRPYIVMALVPGESLETRVKADGPFGLLDSIRIASQIAAGLSAAHGQGLIHRDIKPANILIEHDNNRVLITDFGLARAADDAGMTQTGWLAGTPHYMSPEQAAGESIDYRSDLFSLGSVIYFLATGREPFRAEKPFAVLQKIVHQDPTPIRSVNPDITQTLADIVDVLLMKDPEQRFANADEVQKTLVQYLAHLQNPAGHEKPVLRNHLGSSTFSGRWKKSFVAISQAVAVALCLMVMVVGMWAWTQSNGLNSWQSNWSSLWSTPRSEQRPSAVDESNRAFSSPSANTLTQPSQPLQLQTMQTQPMNEIFTEAIQLDRELESLDLNMEQNGTTNVKASTPLQTELSNSIRELEMEIYQFENSNSWFEEE